MWELKLIASGVECVGRPAVVETLPKSRNRYSILPVQLPHRRNSAPAPSAQPALVVWLVNGVLTGLMLAVTKGMSTGILIGTSTGTGIGSASSPSLTTPSVTLCSTPGITLCVTP